MLRRQTIQKAQFLRQSTPLGLCTPTLLHCFLRYALSPILSSRSVTDTFPSVLAMMIVFPEAEGAELLAQVHFDREDVSFDCHLHVLQVVLRRSVLCFETARLRPDSRTRLSAG